MIDKLIEFLTSMLDKVLPFWIVKQWQMGIRLRGGKYISTLGPGFYLKWPFMDEIYVTHVVTTTLPTPAQSLTTKDGKQVVTKGVVKYKISNVKLYLLSIYDSKDALSDTSQGIIKEQITQREWKDCADNELDNKISSKIRLEVKKWGIEVEKYTTTSIGIISSIRLFNEVENLKDEYKD